MIILPFDIAFTACSVENVWCSVAYWLTQSAGKYGTLTIVIVASILYTIRLTNWRDRAKTFLKSVIALMIFLSAFAYTNEYLTKPWLHLFRPSHSFMLKQTSEPLTLDSLYRLGVEDRQQFLKNLISKNTFQFKKIDQRVLSHWIDEAGFSFPSGHSFNAFLLASIIAFSLYHVQNRWVQRFYFLPFIWAVAVGVSRVAIGAHSPLDVSAGAALGILVSHIFIYFDVTRRLIIHKKHIE